MERLRGLVLSIALWLWYLFGPLFSLFVVMGWLALSMKRSGATPGSTGVGFADHAVMLLATGLAATSYLPLLKLSRRASWPKWKFFLHAAFWPSLVVLACFWLLLRQIVAFGLF